MFSTAGAELVRGCLTAWESGDRAALEALLAEEFTFTSPNDDHLTREEFWEVCWVNHREIRQFTILSLMSTEDDAFVLYECTLQSGRRFQNTEYFRFKAGKVSGVTVFFGRTVSGVDR